MDDALVGREAELAALEGFLERVAAGPAALLLEGEAGIGKTALWLAGVRAAREREIRVLSARPTRAEARMSFAGLGDLMNGVEGETVPELPPPQRRALETALALTEGEGPADKRILGIAFRGVLSQLAARRRLVLAIDDVQWLDRPSASILAFGLRRLEAERVGLLATVRLGRDESAPELALPEERVTRLALAPLTLGALHELLRARLGLALSRRQLLRVHEATAGNPFYALEIGRELRRLESELAPNEPLPLPDTLHELLRSRLARLPTGTREVLLHAAALARPTLDLLEAAVGDDRRVAVALERAVRAGVVELDDSTVRFAHPLLASVLFADASARMRRASHRRLSAVVTDPEERARHLALSSVGADAEVAAALDRAARHASDRGAPAASAELAELAAELTAPEEEDANRRRRAEAAEYHSAAGDFARARTILEQLVGELPAGSRRADVLVQLAWTRGDDTDACVGLYERALEDAGGDDRRLARIHRLIAYARIYLGDFQGGLDHVRGAVAAAERTGDRTLVAASLARLAHLELAAGQVAPGVLERALELEPESGYLSGNDSPTLVDGWRLMLVDRLDVARERFEAALSTALEHGDEWAHLLVVANLGLLEWRAGRWDQAARHAAEADAFAEQFGSAAAGSQTRSATLHHQALIDAHRGRVDEARAAAEEGAAISRRVGETLYEIQNVGVLGFVELSLDNLEAADRHLRPLPERILAFGWREPTYFPVWPNTIEALLGVGDVAQARVYLEQYEQLAERSPSPWALSTAARCRGLLTVAEGDFPAAFSWFERALAEHARMPGPFERGRTLLALGATQRRAKQKRAARESLGQALADFEEVGAPLWVEKARSELARISGRRPASTALTETERRVAALVAEGLSNKEVAAHLYVSVPTVEGHLSRIYRKLEVRSRTQLAHRLADTSAAKV